MSQQLLFSGRPDGNGSSVNIRLIIALANSSRLYPKSLDTWESSKLRMDERAVLIMSLPPDSSR